MQHLIAEGLLNSGSTEAKEFAEDIATRWVRTNYAAYKSSGAMHEKYDVEACGKSGGGGEYKPQVWTCMLGRKVKALRLCSQYDKACLYLINGEPYTIYSSIVCCKL